MLLDHFILCFGLAFLGFLFIGILFFVFGKPDKDSISLNSTIFIFILSLLFFSIYFNKDGIGGKSPAKRILGLRVIDVKTNKVANPIQCVIRNLTIILWPIEVIFSVINVERRIGDYIAGTKVILDDKSLTYEINYLQLTAALFIGTLYFLFFIYYFIPICCFRLF